MTPYISARPSEFRQSLEISCRRKQRDPTLFDPCVRGELRLRAHPEDEGARDAPPLEHPRQYERLDQAARVERKRAKRAFHDAAEAQSCCATVILRDRPGA